MSPSPNTVVTGSLTAAALQEQQTCYLAAVPSGWLLSTSVVGSHLQVPVLALPPANTQVLVLAAPRQVLLPIQPASPLILQESRLEEAKSIPITTTNHLPQVSVCQTTAMSASSTTASSKDHVNSHSPHTNTIPSPSDTKVVESHPSRNLKFKTMRTYSRKRQTAVAAAIRDRFNRHKPSIQPSDIASTQPMSNGGHSSVKTAPTDDDDRSNYLRELELRSREALKYVTSSGADSQSIETKIQDLQNYTHAFCPLRSPVNPNKV